MSLFGGGASTFGTTGVFNQQQTNTQTNVNPMKDIEVSSPPDDSVSSLAFSPATLPSTFLIGGSWDNNVSLHLVTSTHVILRRPLIAGYKAQCCLLQVRCWEVNQQGQTIPKAQQTHTGPVLDVAWSDVCIHSLVSQTGTIFQNIFVYIVYIIAVFKPEKESGACVVSVI